MMRLVVVVVVVVVREGKKRGGSGRGGGSSKVIGSRPLTQGEREGGRERGRATGLQERGGEEGKREEGRIKTYPEALDEFVHHVRSTVDSGSRGDRLGVEGMHVLPRGQHLQGGREGGRDGG